MNVWIVYFITLALSVSGLLSAWHVVSTKEFKHFNSLIDHEYSQCPTNPPNSSDKYAVVVFFNDANLLHTIALLSVWVTDEYYPFVRNSNHPRPDLIFLGVKYDEAVEAVIDACIKDEETITTMITDCFSSWRVEYSSTPNVKEYKSEGFYYALEHFQYEFLDFVYSSMFPVRPGWLGHHMEVAYASDSQFWVRDMIVRRTNCFRNFVQKIRNEFRMQPFKASAKRYLQRRKNCREAQHILPYIMETGDVGYFDDELITTKEILAQYDDMNLAHGIGFLKSINDVLREERLRLGPSNALPF